MMTDDASDILLRRVRNLRAFLTDTQIVVKLVDSGEATPENVWLAIHGARILDGESDVSE
jgi:hypothetical protein